MAINQALFIIYILVSLFFVLLQISKIKHSSKVIAFVTSFWLLTFSVFNTDEIRIEIGSIALRPNRLIGFALLFFLLFYPKAKGKAAKFLSFEKSLIVFFVISFLIMLLQLGDKLSYDEMVKTYTGWLVFGVIYFTMKKFSSKELVKIIASTIIFLAFASTFVGLIQFFIDPKFMRIGVERGAFGQLIRANGLFFAEYTQSYFLLVATVLSYFFIKNKKIKFLAIGFFSIGIFLTFHRMSWIVYFLSVAIIYFNSMSREKRNIQIISIIFAIVLSSIIIIPIVSNILNYNSGNSLIEGRLMSDTMSGRELIWAIALDRIPEYWFTGVGGIQSSSIYYSDASTAGLIYGYNKPLTMHNLFISIPYHFGLPVAIPFFIFLFSSVNYFRKRVTRENKMYLIPMLTVLLFILANLTNAFYPFSDFSLLVALVLGLFNECDEYKNIKIG